VIEKLIKDQLILSAHDVSEGGVFVTLTESGLNRNLGYQINTNKNFRKDAWLFGEAQSRVIVSVAAHQVAAFEASLNASNTSFESLGKVTEGTIEIDNENWGDIKVWGKKYDQAIENLLAGNESEQALTAL
jgi:phosphoribosylformylglycinamidine synthase